MCSTSHFLDGHGRSCGGKSDSDFDGSPDHGVRS
jgi:hypothetical protein